MKSPIPETRDTLPDWITSELLTETIAVWQPYYSEDLTKADAIEILLTINHLLDVWGDSDDESVSCSSTCI